MMNTKYFANCTTGEEAKKLYHKLAMKMHPDNGGNAEQFKEMKAEFENVFESLKNCHRNAQGETYTKETTETAGEFAEMIERLIHIENITVEICGSWLWVSGDTRACKDILKEMRFKWSKNKAAWYFHFEPYRKHNKKKYSLDEIRSMFGSEQFTAQPFKAIEATA